MKKLLAIFIFATVFVCQNTVAQIAPENSPKQVQQEYPENHIYKTLERNAEFPGGINKFREFFVANFNFPNELTESIRLNITFVVEKDGSLTDIKLSSSIGYGIPEEVQRVLVSSPKWEPGYDKGKPVRSLFRFPITLQFE